MIENKTSGNNAHRRLSSYTTAGQGKNAHRQESSRFSTSPFIISQDSGEPPLIGASSVDPLQMPSYIPLQQGEDCLPLLSSSLENPFNEPSVGLGDHSGFDRPPSQTTVVSVGYPPSSLVIMGLKRSGKTSIRKVVFQKMSPNETLFVESTQRITTEYITESFVNVEVIEFPGQMELERERDRNHHHDRDRGHHDRDRGHDKPSANALFSRCNSLIWVIDAQADYDEAVKKMVPTMIRAFNINKNIKLEVFVHKVDGLSEETKMETHRRIFQTVQDDLADQGMDHIRINYHMTSIYDHSIFEAFSKVIQKLIRQLSTLESLLDIFNQGSNVEKSFLFDVASKIYIATDSSPVDMATYELCCDMIDVTIDISGIYGGPHRAKLLQTSGSSGSGPGGAAPMTPPPFLPSISQCSTDVCGSVTEGGFDRDSSAVIFLKTRQVIFLKQINPFLALVSVIKEDNFERQGLIDFNFNVFKKGIEDVFELSRRRGGGGSIGGMSTATLGGPGSISSPSLF